MVPQERGKDRVGPAGRPRARGRRAGRGSGCVAPDRPPRLRPPRGPAGERRRRPPGPAALPQGRQQKLERAGPTAPHRRGASRLGGEPDCHSVSGAHVHGSRRRRRAAGPPPPPRPLRRRRARPAPRAAASRPRRAGAHPETGPRVAVARAGRSRVAGGEGRHPGRGPGPATATTANSRPLAAWTVITLTPSWPSACTAAIPSRSSRRVRLLGERRGSPGGRGPRARSYSAARRISLRTFAIRARPPGGQHREVVVEGGHRPLDQRLEREQRRLARSPRAMPQKAPAARRRRSGDLVEPLGPAPSAARRPDVLARPPPGRGAARAGARARPGLTPIAGRRARRTGSRRRAGSRRRQQPDQVLDLLLGPVAATADHVRRRPTRASASS